VSCRTKELEGKLESDQGGFLRKKDKSPGKAEEASLDKTMIGGRPKRSLNVVRRELPEKGPDDIPHTTTESAMEKKRRDRQKDYHY